MRGDDSAYAALGLRPGASAAQVDEAYRRLIKQHHPDRIGGDSGRAAEINRAYSLLRKQGDAGVYKPVPVRVRPAAKRPARRIMPLVLAIVTVLAAALLVNSGNHRRSRSGAYAVPSTWQPPIAAEQAELPHFVETDFDQPLPDSLVDHQVDRALMLYGDGDASAAVAFSRACHESLRDQPSIVWFDSCAAFDEASMLLQANDAAESGAFASPSVVAREMSAARLLTNDVVSADSRLHRIRSRVEMTLLPRLDNAAGQDVR